MHAIYVDLDGTLIRSDLLMESLLATARAQPLRLLFVPWWLLRGRACLKENLAAAGGVDVRTLPYRAELVEWLQQQARSGHRLILTTAANERLARAVASHVALFDETLASTATVKQIAFALGFKDTAYFSRFFSKHAGQSPASFRKRR